MKTVKAAAVQLSPVLYKGSEYTYCISRRNFSGGMHLRVR